MKLRFLPRIGLENRPTSIKFKPSENAAARFDAKAADGESFDVEVLGTIGESFFDEAATTAKSIREQLKKAGNKDISVLVNSPGGDVFDGFAIYNLLRDHPGQVNVKVIGIAASAASVIAMAGDTIHMGEAAQFMIHNSSGAVYGSKEDMEAMQEVLATIDQSAAYLYAARTKRDENEILQMMAKETWLNGGDAVELGFTDSATVKGKRVTAASVRREAAKPKQSLSLMHKVFSAPGAQQPLTVTMSLSKPPGVAGHQSKQTGKGTAMTLAEQLAALEAKRSANTARMQELMKVSAEEGRTFEDEEATEYEELETEVKKVDAHIKRLKDHQSLMASQSEPVEGKQPQGSQAGKISQAVSAGQSGGDNYRSGIVSVAPNVEKGIPFTRYVKALAMARGNLTGALAIAQGNKNWKDTTPQVEKVLMAAVAGGDTTTSGWASELVYNENLVAEFIEILRPATILGRMAGVTRVPFNVRMSGADSGSSAYWVGQGAPVPVSKMNTLEVTLGIAKAAGLVVLTEELVRSSSPSAELLVRNDLVGSIGQFLDQQFVDPGYAAVSNVSPASITNGVTATTPTGTTAAALRTDIQTMFNNWIQNNINPAGGVFIMSPVSALAISLMRTSLDTPEFPGITINGGTFFGLPVVVSNSANIAGSPDSGDMIILANARDILMADEGQITIDASREAAIQMLDNPTNNAASGTATTMVSMFQTNSVAIKAVRFINWAKKRSTAVEFIQDAAYRA